MWYEICPLCGAHLDPGEKCDCEKKQEEYIKNLKELINIPKHKGEQLKFK